MRLVAAHLSSAQPENLQRLARAIGAAVVGDHAEQVRACLKRYDELETIEAARLFGDSPCCSQPVDLVELRFGYTFVCSVCAASRTTMALRRVQGRTCRR